MEPLHLNETPAGMPAEGPQRAQEAAAGAPQEEALTEAPRGEEPREEPKGDGPEEAPEGVPEDTPEDTYKDAPAGARGEGAEGGRPAELGAPGDTPGGAEDAAGAPGGARRARRRGQGGAAADVSGALGASEAVLARICKELILPRAGAAAAMALLAEGNTVPFIARYRKEATGSLDEVAIRAVEERMAYFGELLERRATVMKTIDKAGGLTPELRSKIEGAWTKTELEDLYLPYRPKKRTKATVARGLGLEALLDELLLDETGADPLMLASPYVREGQEGLGAPSACLEGAGHILAERLSEDAGVRAWLRQEFYDKGTLTSRLREARKEYRGGRGRAHGPEGAPAAPEHGPAAPGAQAPQAPETSGAAADAQAPRPPQAALRFRPYWDYSEAIRKMPPHRVLAVRRGEKEDVLSVRLVVDRERLVAELASRVAVSPKSMYRASLRAVCEDAFDRLLAPALETDVRVEAKKRADADAIRVFQANLDSLLLAPPAGQTCTLGVDPGIRTGCKLAVINRLGQFMEAATVYPLEPKRDLEGTAAALGALAEKYPIETIAVGNGTGGREAEAVVRRWLADTGREGVRVVSVSEAGASVYSASDIAREEFPDLDLTVRGAISIARRFQDPLAELVKVEPKSIGVGQYQHDVNQTQLKKGLDDSVASCVNRVGVDLNSASFKLLSYVSGIGEALAKNIVQWMYENGAFRRREQLMDVPRFGEKAFQQSAGFLRIRDGENPLDASAVHPESYAVVQRICQLTGKTVQELIGDGSALDSLDPASLTDERFGQETVRDIIGELKKPGRDPRRRFEAVRFAEGINRLSDLAVGMELQGVVANVTDFGAFVDVGVHQDGLVHRSEIAHRFVQRPGDALAVGQPVKVKVLSVDHEAKRIGLSIKALLPTPQARPARREGPPPEGAERAGGERRRERPRRAEEGRPARPQRPEAAGKRRAEDRPADGPGWPEGRPQERRRRPERPEGRPLDGQADAAPRTDDAPAHPPRPKRQEGQEGQAAQAARVPAAPATLGDLMARFNRGLR